MDLSHRVVMVISAQVQRQTNKTASEMLSILKLKSLASLKLFNKPITTISLTAFRLQINYLQKGNEERRSTSTINFSNNIWNRFSAVMLLNYLSSYYQYFFSSPFFNLHFAIPMRGLVLYLVQSGS